MDYALSANLLGVIVPAVVAAATASGSILMRVKYQSRKKREYDANRARLSADLITMDEHIGFAEASAEEWRVQYLQQARLALNAAFQAHNHHFGDDNHKGVSVRRATEEVENHLGNARYYLAVEPQVHSNSELITAAKELGRTFGQLAKIGAAKLMASSAQSINRWAVESEAQTPQVSSHLGLGYQPPRVPAATNFQTQPAPTGSPLGQPVAQPPGQPSGEYRFSRNQSR
jgi:hypothetical protein